MGAQQGDPLGPLLFCLAVHELLSALKSELALGYLDDIEIGGDVRTVSTRHVGKPATNVLIAKPRSQ